MLNLTRVLELTETQKDAIQELIDESGQLMEGHWYRKEATLRKSIRSSLMSMQNNFCVYCGCPTFGAEDVEHIAHKSDYPQFVFTPKNLAYSCKMCNQTFKGKIDIVTHLHTDYVQCQFKMVHPYLDDVNHYFDTSKFEIKILPGLSPREQAKAEYTQKLLHWTDPSVTLRRAAAHMIQQYSEEHNTSLAQTVLDDTLTYRPGIL